MSTTYTFILREGTEQAAAQGAQGATSREQAREQMRHAVQEMVKAEKAAAAGVSDGNSPRVIVGGREIVIAPGIPAAPPAPPAIGTTAPPSGPVVIPPQALDLAYGFFLMLAVMVVGLPIARAFGRRIERRGDTAALPPAAADQLRRIEQAVEAMAIEVERISESQRFMAKLQSGSTAERV